MHDGSRVLREIIVSREVQHRVNAAEQAFPLERMPRIERIASDFPRTEKHLAMRKGDDIR